MRSRARAGRCARPPARPQRRLKGLLGHFELRDAFRFHTIKPGRIGQQGVITLCPNLGDDLPDPSANGAIFGELPMQQGLKIVLEIGGQQREVVEASRSCVGLL